MKIFKLYKTTHVNTILDFMFSSNVILSGFFVCLGKCLISIADLVFYFQQRWEAISMKLSRHVLINLHEWKHVERAFSRNFIICMKGYHSYQQTFASNQYLTLHTSLCTIFLWYLQNYNIIL